MTQVGSYSLADALVRFRNEVSPQRRGRRWEELRLASFQEREKRLCARPISSLSESDFAEWRDIRCGEVSASTVRRELALLGAVFSVALREWKWLSRNPLHGIKKPSAPAARRRGVNVVEVDAISRALEGEGNNKQVLNAFLLALETGMRAGEILGLTWGHVDLVNRVVTLPKTKNGDSRQVPLSNAAVEIVSQLDLKALGGVEKAIDPASSEGVVFTITGPTLDVLFRRARDKAALSLPSCKTVRFHDSRSEAITRLSRKLDVLELARVVGHRDPKSLMSYYAASAADLAKKLG